MDLPSLQHAVKIGVDTRQWDLFEEWIYKNSLVVFKDKDEKDRRIPDDVFDFMNRCLHDESFLKARDSYDLLVFMEQNWGILSEAQKQSLFQSIIYAFPRFKNHMGRFVSSELLGDYFADEAALNALCAFASSDSPAVRVLIPMGLKNIKHSAYKKLKEMTLDKDDAVAGEALDMISRDDVADEAIDMFSRIELP